jgi:hypothetical protein
MRPLLGFRLDYARHIPAPVLARRLADHIDEFRLVGHGSLPGKRCAFVWPASLLATV